MVYSGGYIGRSRPSRLQIGPSAVYDAAAIGAHAAVAFVIVGRAQAENPSFGEDGVGIDARDDKSRAAIGDDAAGEFQLPGDRLIHFPELDRVRLGLQGRHDRWLFAAEITRRLQRVNADIHECAAAGQVPLQAPLVRVADAEAEASLDDFGLAKNLLRASRMHS